jgi:hypothetical protein
MALVDCSLESQTARCGSLVVLANLSSSAVRLDVQYPGNENVWYTLGGLGPRSQLQTGASNLMLPGDSLLRVADGERYYLVGRILENSENLFYVPERAFL